MLQAMVWIGIPIRSKYSKTDVSWNLSCFSATYSGLRW